MKFDFENVEKESRFPCEFHYMMLYKLYHQLQHTHIYLGGSMHYNDTKRQVQELRFLFNALVKIEKIAWIDETDVKELENVYLKE